MVSSFFTSDGGLNKADIKDILERASRIYEESAHCGKQEQTGVVTRVDYMSVYASDLVQAVRKSAGNREKPLEGLHIVVDAGNGAGGFFCGQGTKTIRSCYCWEPIPGA